MCGLRTKRPDCRVSSLVVCARASSEEGMGFKMDGELDLTQLDLTPRARGLSSIPGLREGCQSGNERRRTQDWACPSALGTLVSFPISGVEKAPKGVLNLNCMADLLLQSIQRQGGRSGQVKLILSPKQRAKPAASRTRTCANAAVCIASGDCPSRF